MWVIRFMEKFPWLCAWCEGSSVSMVKAGGVHPVSFSDSTTSDARRWVKCRSFAGDWRLRFGHDMHTKVLKQCQFYCKTLAIGFKYYK